uniref:Ubiquitin-like domain-containing protein n=1 Tax=Mola mola TaxID=94237 RepID=A0A3Q3WW73_MOLML
MVIQLQVNGPLGEIKIVDLCQSEQHLRKITVMQLKDKIAEQLIISMSAHTLFLFLTVQMDESSLLSTYRIQHMSTIHTVLMLPGGL